MNKIIIILVLGFQFCGYSQNAQDLIDKLKVELKSKPDAKKTATIYSDLTWYYSNISIDSALVYGNKAIESSQKLGDSTLIAQVYSDVGSVYFRKGDYANSKKNYLQAYKIRQKRKDYAGLAKVNINLGSIYQSEKKFDKAISSYLNSINYFESQNNQEIVNSTKANLGILFYEIQDYPKAFNYLKNANNYELKNKLYDKLCNSFLNLGNVSLKLNDSLQAINYFKKSIYYAKLIGNKKTESSAYSNLGVVMTEQNKSSKAKDYYQKSLNLRKDENSEIEKSSLDINIATQLIKEQNFLEAKNKLLNAEIIFKKFNSSENLMLTNKLLLTIYAYLKKPDSTEYRINQYSNFKDKILTTSIQKQTAELETKYQTAKKEKQLLEKETEAKKRNQLIIGLIVLSLFIAIIGYLIYRQQKLKNKQQIQSFELKQAINQIETQNKLQSQRLAISKDLHDNIGAQLTFIISSVETAKFAPEIENTKLGNKLTKISDFTKDTIVELRDTIWAMNSNEISFEELQSRILNFIEKANAATENIDFKFNIDQNLNDIKLTSIAGMNIYRTIQEAINNSLKYANASKITVDIKKLNDKIEIEIIDNGHGFDKENSIVGNGLSNMQKRIEEIDGTFNLSSIVKQGTQIKIIIDNKSKISVL